jgi:hypothetical protein
VVVAANGLDRRAEEPTDDVSVCRREQVRTMIADADVSSIVA